MSEARGPGTQLVITAFAALEGRRDGAIGANFNDANSENAALTQTAQRILNQRYCLGRAACWFGSVQHPEIAAGFEPNAGYASAKRHVSS